jgi:cephalosporin hydroxylase
MQNLILPLEQFFDPNYTDKGTTHSYLPVYETVLKELMNRHDTIRVMEIGIQRGGSIIGWLKALPGSSVTGVDCQKTVRIDCPNYKEYIMNAYDEEEIQNISDRYDFIVEDGSHAFSDLLFVCKHYTKFLNPGGVLIIEDIPDVNWIPKMIRLLPQNYHANVVDLRQVKGRWDDVMLIIKEKV